MSYRAARVLRLLLVVSVCSNAATLLAINYNGAATWLATQQKSDGTFGNVAELAPRDTARAALALTLARQSGPIAPAYAWLAAQRGLSANEFLAEQALAMRASSLDATTPLARLAQQQSGFSADFGGFADHAGNTYDSALALQALATNEAQYTSAIAGVVASLTARQNVDGGWGLDASSSSNVLITGEVLLGLSAVTKQQVNRATIAAAQQYLVRARQANGAFGTTALETAVAFRALGFSGYDVSAIDLDAFLNTQQLPDGSFGGDVYVTARVLEAYTGKPNLVLQNAQVSSATVSEGTQVTVSATIRNSGSADTATFGTFEIRLDDDKGRVLATVGHPRLGPGQSAPLSASIDTTGISGTHTLILLADTTNVIDEYREDDNRATVTLTVNGRPDLALLASDVAVVPARPEPGKSAQLTFVVRNDGRGDAPAAAYAIYDRTGSAAETRIATGTTTPIAAGSSQSITLTQTFTAGAHTLRFVIDPDNAIAETNETNNEVTRPLAIGVASNIDLRIAPNGLTVDNNRPSAGTVIHATVLVTNAGTAGASTTIAFYDGVPGAGGVAFAVQPTTIAPGASAQLQVTYTTTATSRVIYAVADPDDLIPEVDERNNAAFVALTDQLADLAVSRDTIVLPGTPLSDGQPILARVTVRNLGAVAATHVPVAVYDGLPQDGARKVIDTFVDVAPFATATVRASWPATAGQRVATVVVNGERSLFEPDYTNDVASRSYTVAGNGPDLTIAPSDIDRSALTVNASTLAVSGTLRAAINVPATVTTPFAVTLFDDVDGDQSFNPAVDVTLGSTLVTGGAGRQLLAINAAGTLRFAPGRLMLAVDSGNAIAESREDNNVVDLDASCATQTFSNRRDRWATKDPVRAFTAVGRVFDTNHNGIVDQDDTPIVVAPAGGAVRAYNGTDGAVLWTNGLDTRAQSGIVLADLDGDGRPEVIAHTNHHRIAALDAATGAVKWTSPELELDPNWALYAAPNFRYMGNPLVVDLDGDGIAEVVVGRTVLNGNDGSIRWVGAGGSGRAFDTSSSLQYEQGFPDQETPIAVDVDGDGHIDIVAGNTVYRADGSILWQRADLGDGYAAPVYFAGDATPKIALAGHGRISVLRSDGTTLWSAAIPAAPGLTTLLGGAPTVFSDAFGVWIGVAGDGAYTVFNAANGGIRWSTQTTSDLSFGIVTTNAATAFEFGPNLLALSYVARDGFYIWRASDGALLVADGGAATSVFAPGRPAIADVNGDGRADIVIASMNGLKVVSDDTWNWTPAIDNEHAYHVANVADETAAIPSHEFASAFSRGFFRANASTAPALLAKPNLTASYPRIDGAAFPGPTGLTVRIGNSGWGIATASPVAFYDAATNALLGTSTAPALAPGAYADVTIVLPGAPAGTLSMYGAANDDGHGAHPVIECDGGDNRSPVATLALSADVAADPASLLASDTTPRPGDVITLSAEAKLTGAIDPAQLNAQFFLGTTAISSLVPVTVTQSLDGQRFAGVQTQWTVNAPQGAATIRVVFDPANVVPETDETNNAATTTLTISSATPIRSVSGALTFDPPGAESGATVAINALLRNDGNVALQNTTMTYAITGASGVVASGSQTIASLAKNVATNVTLGTFTPTADGNYTVTITPSDPTIAVAAPAATIKIGPFATATLDVTPLRVPVSLPMIQCHVRVARTNLVKVATDPLVTLISTRVESAAAWLAPVATGKYAVNTCFACHTHAFALNAITATRRIPGARVDAASEATILHAILASQDGIGDFSHNSNGTTTAQWVASRSQAGGWALSGYRGDENVTQPILRAASLIVARQSGDNGFTADYVGASLAHREVSTLLSLQTIDRAWQLTRDAKYLDSMNRTATWLLGYDYVHADASWSATVALSMVSIRADVDTALRAQFDTRVREIAASILAQQNADGTFGPNAAPKPPIIRNARVIEMLASGGLPQSDPRLRKAVLWLLNQQEPAGSWYEPAGDPNTPGSRLEETSYAMSALAAYATSANTSPGPLASLAISATAESQSSMHHLASQANAPSVSAFGTDLTLQLPSTSTFVSANTNPDANALIGSTRALTWHIADLDGAGRDYYVNLTLDGIQVSETRPALGAGVLAYTRPDTNAPVTRPLTIPNVTGDANVALSLTTDRATYGANETAHLTARLTPRDGVSGTMTNDVVIRDAIGAVVGSVASDTITVTPSHPFSGWHYVFPLVANVVTSGGNRTITLPVDFRQQLAQAGVAATLDRNSIRVTSDAAPTDELAYAFLASSTDPSVGQLVITVPESASGTFAMHVWFDSIDHGFKPASLFDRSVSTNANSSGLVASYYNFDLPRTVPNPMDPSQIAVTGAPVLVRTLTTTNLPLYATDPYPYVVVWNGSFYVAAAGAYTFIAGSDDAVWLDIDGNRVINNAGQSGRYTEVTASVTLTAGFHALHLTSFNYFGEAPIVVKMAPAGGTPTFLTTPNLFPSLPADDGTTRPGATVALADDVYTRSYDWNVGTTAAGAYSAAATLRQNGSPLAVATAPFAISGSSQVVATASTDKSAYDAGEIVHATALVRYANGNVALANVAATIAILDPSGATLATASVRATTLQPGGSIPATLDWNSTSAAPGTYSVRITATGANGVLATQTAPFTIRSGAQTGKGLSGTLTSPATASLGSTVTFDASVTNGGNAPLANAPFEIRLVDPATQTLAASVAFKVDAAQGATTTAHVPFTPSSIAAQRYDVWLVSMISGTPQPLASSTITITAPAVTVTLASDKPAYDTGEVAHLTASLAPAATSGTATIAINGTSATMQLAGNSTVTYDWNVGTTAPGTYPATATIKDANGNVIATASTNVTVNSSATTGAGVTGTLTGPASATQGSTVTLTATITNNGNAPLVNASFNVGSQSFTASVAVGAAFTTTVPYVASQLGTNTVNLTGFNRTLATATINVTPQPVSVTLASDKPSYDLNDVARFTATIAPAQSSGTATIAINGTSSTTQLTGNSTATYDWNVGATAPSTYPATVTIKDANGNVVATASTNVTVNSSAATGAGVTGTLTGPASATQGSTVTLTATITNNGNAPLVNASFNVGSQSFNASVAIGATFTTTVPYLASQLGANTIALTGFNRALATTTINVTAQPVAVTLASDKPSYDLNDVAHFTATITPAQSSGTATIAINGTSSTKQLTGTSTVTYDWNVGATAPGTYPATATIKDANGNVVATASTNVTVNSSATTGAGVTGTLTGPASATQGSTVTLTATITNNGNAPLVNASFNVGSQLFTASVPVGATFTTTVPYVASQLGTSTITLTGFNRTLATKTINVTVNNNPTLDATITGPARVAIWANCSPGNSGKTCTPTAPPFLTQTLTAARMPWSVLGDEYSFMDAVRTGSYSVAIIDMPPSAEPKIAGELLRTIAAGEGLFFIDNTPDANPKLAPALGVGFGGKQKTSSTTLQLAASPFTQPGTLAMNGNTFAMSLTGARAAATNLATGAPALAYNTYGAGHTVVLPFDLEQTKTTAAAQLTTSAVTWLARGTANDACAVVPIDFVVTPPAGGSAAVTLTLAIPQQVTVVDTQPHVTTTPPAWTFTPAAGGTHVTIWLRLPEAIGSYTVTASLAYGSQVPFATKNVALTVTADRAGIENALGGDLSALAASVPPANVHTVTDAQNQLAAIRNANPTTQADIDAVITRVLNIINDLDALPGDTTAARTDAARLLTYWQSRSGL